MKSPWRALLPKSVEVGGKERAIRSDYRAVLDICAALSDPELSDQDRAAVVLEVFYTDFEDLAPGDYDEAIQKCFWFINCGAVDAPKQQGPRLVDWEKDFAYIVSPINRVVGKEIRAMEYMHWWTFISAYYEIGDCLFAQIVRIRELLARGKPLDRSDRAWYQKNRHLVDIQTRYTPREDELMKKWGV